MTVSSIEEIIEKALSRFDPERSGGVDASVQIHLTGNQAGNWLVTICDQKLSVEPGTISDPDLTFTADSEDVLKVYNRDLDPIQAYFLGKVRFRGDISLAMRLASLFHYPK